MSHQGIPPAQRLGVAGAAAQRSKAAEVAGVPQQQACQGCQEAAAVGVLGAQSTAEGSMARCQTAGAARLARAGCQEGVADRCT
jgi:hypothetical protein